MTLIWETFYVINVHLTGCQRIWGLRCEYSIYDVVEPSELLCLYETRPKMLHYRRTCLHTKFEILIWKCSVQLKTLRCDYKHVRHICFKTIFDGYLVKVRKWHHINCSTSIVLKKWQWLDFPETRRRDYTVLLHSNEICCNI